MLMKAVSDIDCWMAPLSNFKVNTGVVGYVSDIDR